jgi:hypothetical protein
LKKYCFFFYFLFFFPFFKFLTRNVVVLVLHICSIFEYLGEELASVEKLRGMFLGNNKVIFFLFLKTFHTFLFLYMFCCFSPFCLFKK